MFHLRLKETAGPRDKEWDMPFAFKRMREMKEGEGISTFFLIGQSQISRCISIRIFIDSIKNQLYRLKVKFMKSKINKFNIKI